MQIPVFDLKRQLCQIRPQINKAVSQVLNSGFFILGKNVSCFEQEFAHYCRAKYAVALASGTDALRIALQACGIKPGDEVITTPFTFLATAESIYNVGAKIVFADINLDSYTVDPKEIERKITKKTKAIVCVHLYGQPCQMQAISALSRKYNLRLIEDCAQATGAEYQGKKVGTFGDVGCFSFYPTKNLGAYGDGGMIITNNQRIAKVVRMLREYGSKDRCHYLLHGYNSRLDELQAAILRIKLKYLDKWNAARREKAAYYHKRLSAWQERGLLCLPQEQKDTRHVFHLYVVRTKRRPALREFLQSAGITTAIHYAIALHLTKIYQQLKYKRGDFPQAELASRQIITLPLYPELKKEEIDYIAAKIAQFFKE